MYREKDSFHRPQRCLWLQASTAVSWLCSLWMQDAGLCIWHSKRVQFQSEINNYPQKMYTVELQTNRDSPGETIQLFPKNLSLALSLLCQSKLMIHVTLLTWQLSLRTMFRVMSMTLWYCIWALIKTNIHRELVGIWVIDCDGVNGSFPVSLIVSHGRL